ncbi:MAG TPA: alginate export family protein, partial [Candidatus Bathyarchaeia archaeon]|nr:alginate export family protein [Candidatus Bathyarchaeia archaeon]
MKTLLITAGCIAVLANALPAGAELQNVAVGGSIRIRGNWYSSEATGDSLTGRNPFFQVRGTPSWRGYVDPVTGLWGNPLAGARWAAQPGRLPVWGWPDWDSRGSSAGYVDQRITLNVRADFTERVSACIELDSYAIWGEDFRSDYVTGVDRRAVSIDDLEVFQSYIEANDMFGVPLRLRVGRQELLFGSQWLVGSKVNGAYYPATSFDAVRATYATDLFSVDAWWAKLADTSPVEEDGDTDFYGVYASYLGIENVTFDAYYLLLRDAQALAATNGTFIAEWLEDVFAVDNFDPTYLHTVGMRGAGTLGAIDFEAEVAYQFGEAGAAGITFAGAGLLSPYGPDDAEFDNWGANLEVGYTFDAPMSPRIYIGGAYLGGEDTRDIGFVDWLGAVACPFWSASSSVSFNRLFSNWVYSEFLANSDLSNAWVGRAGISVNPTENTNLLLAVSYFETLEPYKSTWPAYFLLG